jgi:hypothetical protein
VVIGKLEPVISYGVPFSFLPHYEVAFYTPKSPGLP